jgi:CRISPR/Cas system-associated exonuclease Cas4 (RecB family)
MTEDAILETYGHEVTDPLEKIYLFGLLADETSYPLKGGSLRNSEVLDCPRKLRYHYEGIQPSDDEEPSLALRLAWSDGNLHEDAIVQTLRRGGIIVANQQDWVRETIAGVRIYGRIDGKLDKHTLLEIKTIESHEDLAAMTEPKPRHRVQVQLYMRNHNLKTCVFFYKARDTGAFKIFREHINSDLLNEIGENVRTVGEGTLETIPRRRVPECSWCRYRTLCWEGDVPPLNNEPTPVVGTDPITNQAIYDIAELDQGVCRSCGAPIFWATSKNGKKMPVNNMGISHFTDCPNATAHSKKS